MSLARAEQSEVEHLLFDLDSTVNELVFNQRVLSVDEVRTVEASIQRMEKHLNKIRLFQRTKFGC